MSSALSSSCFCSHSCLNCSLSFLSASSRSRSGRNDVSTSGFLRNLARFAADSPFSASGVCREDVSPSPSSSSMANESVVFVFLRFFTFFVSSLNKSSTNYQLSFLHVHMDGRTNRKLHLSGYATVTYLSSFVRAASRAFASSISFLRCWKSSRRTRPTVLFLRVSSMESF